MTKPLLNLQFVGVTLLLGISSLTNAQNVLNIIELNGNKTMIPFKDIRNITFPSADLAVKKINGSNFTLPVASLRKMNFSTDNITSIIESNYADNLFSLYPNPVNDVLTINITKATAQISILDLNGFVVMKQSLNELFNYLNVSSLPNGIYLCKIESEGLIETLKFVK
jgi:hypothetical protein